MASDSTHTCLGVQTPATYFEGNGVIIKSLVGDINKANGPRSKEDRLPTFQGDKMTVTRVSDSSCRWSVLAEFSSGHSCLLLTRQESKASIMELKRT